MSTQRFAGRVAVVTGGASGIGLAIAQRLRREGAQVAVWDRDQQRLAEVAKTEDVHVYDVALQDYSSVQRTYAQTKKDLGNVDILVCSAGITGPNTTVIDYGVEDWKEVFDINVHALFHCNKVVMEDMAAQQYGRVVNIASIAGKEGNPNASAYSASKAAVIALSKSLAKEVATKGVTVNSITPAAVETPMFAQMTQTHIDYMLSKIPMHRFGKVEEMASIVCWLASEEASFSTGAVFDVSGGRATY
ncbi:SDR family NAD(P)-dependent oxidoreductase [Paenalcaligenes suwonensis]|uniref:SDR family NAD(P)-dependent oxidoreductase n=1 Tax=Paenalcaligenes suwonensis TaxID=1202713 RepID=UPI00140AE228|nr:SDR family NAD(P)-dependent oxidoreductase [Paenalcaligenes suwonensis]NHC60045.1 SDR family oxidoreductase [Paenalcaligenes suwonensis]